MGTRSSITVRSKTDNKFYSIYAHWDGYPEHNGRILNTHYKDSSVALELVMLGNVSLLSERLHPTVGSGHNFDNPEPLVCVFYGRDRGWNDCKPSVADKYVNVEENTSMEWEYLFSDDCWYCRATESSKCHWVKLSDMNEDYSNYWDMSGLSFTDSDKERIFGYLINYKRRRRIVGAKSVKLVA